MSYKMQQVLRTKVPLKSEEGNPISPNTRVVVLKMVGGDRVRVRIADRSSALNRNRLVAGVSAFNTTHRGRPRKV
jgi:hypothetical protein